MTIGTTRIKIDGDNIHLIQPDPMTGIKNWIVLNMTEVKELNNFFNEMIVNIKNDL